MAGHLSEQPSLETAPEESDARTETDTEDENDIHETVLQSSDPPVTSAIGRDPRATSSETLFECVRKSPDAIIHAAKQWVQSYEEEKDSALAELLGLLLRGGGLRCPVSVDTIQTNDISAFIQSLPDMNTEFFEEEPFKVKKGLKAFRTGYALIWKEVLKEISAVGLQFDDDFIKQLSTMLIELSGSVIRSLRFVACFVAEHVSVGWIAALNAKMEGLATAEQQLRTEQRKRQNKITAKKIESLTKTVEMYHNHVTRLESMLQRLFDGVFSQRYRDVCEMVRSKSTETIGQWCTLLPCLYLNDHYLKFIAWALSDRAGDVRLAAAACLFKLYGKDDNLMTLREFTVRFRPRMCELVYDVDDAVAVQCTKLLARLAAKDEMPISNIQHVYEILTDDSSTMRHAIADLVCELLKGNAKQKAESTVITKSQDELIFNGLINILCTLAKKQDRAEPRASEVPECWTEEYDITGNFSLSSEFVKGLITPLFSRLNVLKKWEFLLERLNAEIDKGDTADSRLNIVIQVLDCCTQLITEGKNRNNQGRPRKQDNEENAKQEMTCALMEHIGQWINEFQVEKVKVVCFVRMIRCLKLELFVLRSATHHFMMILENIVEVLFKHHDASILEECIHSLVHISTNGPEELKCMGRDCVKAIWKRMINDTEEIVLHFPNLSETDEGRNQLTTWLVTLERLKYLLVADCRDACDTAVLQKHVSDMILICHDVPELAEIAGVSLGQCMFLLLLHSAVDDSNIAADEQSISQKPLIELLRALLEKTTNQSIHWDASSLMVDLYLVFGRDDSNPTSLRFDPEDWMFDALWRILETKLDISATAQLDHLQTQKLRDDIAVLGKLILYGDLGTTVLRQLGSKFVSLLLSPVESVADFVKSVIRQLQKNNHRTLADCFLTSLIEHYDRSAPDSLDSFVGFAQKISSCYMVFNNPSTRGHVHHLVITGIDMAMQPTNLKLKFISDGLSPFTSKLSGKSCEKIKQHVERIKTEQSIAEDEWKPMEAYVRSLAERARRLRTVPEDGQFASARSDALPTVQKYERMRSGLKTKDSVICEAVDKDGNASHKNGERTLPDGPQAPSSPAFSLNSQGVSDSHVFDLNGWELNLNENVVGPSITSESPNEHSSQLANNDPTPHARSVTRSVKMSYARRIEDDDFVASPRKKLKTIETRTSPSQN